MSLEITGKLYHKGATETVTDKFKRREFIVELTDEINGNTYTNYGKFQLVQNKCDILDRYNVGDKVKVCFNIKGNKWERDGKTNFITNLDAWRIEPVTVNYPHNPAGVTQNVNDKPFVDDIPF